MTNQQNYSLNFRIRSNSNDKPVTIKVRLAIGKDRIEFKLDRKIKPKIWCSKSQKAKGSSYEARSLNLYLEAVRRDIFNIYDQLNREGYFVTAKLIRSRYLGEDELQMTLLKAYRFHNEKNSASLAPGTLKHYYSSLKHLERFLSTELRVMDIKLSQVRYNFITRYELSPWKSKKASYRWKPK